MTPTPPRQCQVREDQGFSIVTVGGEVDLSWSAELRKSILEPIEAGKPVLVDLSGVTYIDSSGIASFVEGYQSARKKKLQFGLVAASEAVLGVLKLARLDKVFPLHADFAAARQAPPPKKKG